MGSPREIVEETNREMVSDDHIKAIAERLLGTVTRLRDFLGVYRAETGIFATVPAVLPRLYQIIDQCENGDCGVWVEKELWDLQDGLCADCAFLRDNEDD